MADQPNIIVRFWQSAFRSLLGPAIVPDEGLDSWERERLDALDEELDLEGKPPVDDGGPGLSPHRYRRL